MKIIISGAGGHMGREVCRLATEGMRDSSLAAMVDKLGGEGMLSSVNDFSGDADVIIDFSHHTAAIEVAEYAKKRGIALVMATTGHTDEELAAIKDAANYVPVFMSANMSLGVALLAELVFVLTLNREDGQVSFEVLMEGHADTGTVIGGSQFVIAEASLQVVVHIVRLQRSGLGVDAGPGTPETANGALDLRLHDNGTVLADPGRRLMSQTETFKAVIGGMIEPAAPRGITLGNKGCKTEGLLYQRQGVAVGETVHRIGTLLNVNILNITHFHLHLKRKNSG
jgi:hypothetical protein